MIGETINTKDDQFTIKLTGYEKFIVIDKRKQQHQKYELVHGPDRIWGLTNLTTRVWAPVNSDKRNNLPDLDQFFGTGEDTPIMNALKKINI